MIEKIARAIWKSLPRTQDATWEAQPKHIKEPCRSKAKAALTAMLEPSDAMMNEGMAVAFVENPDGGEDTYPYAIYKAMINTALEEE